MSTTSQLHEVQSLWLRTIRDEREGVSNRCALFAGPLRLRRTDVDRGDRCVTFSIAKAACTFSVPIMLLVVQVPLISR